MENNEEMITIPRAEYEAQKQQILKLEQQVSLLMEAIRLNRHKRFGASSEKTEDESAEQLNFLFNEAEVYAEKTAEEPATVVTAYKRRKKQEYTLNNLPEGVATELVEHRLEGENLVCPKCGDTMTEIGKEVVKTLKIIPAKVVVEEHHYLLTPVRDAIGKARKLPLLRHRKRRISFPAALQRQRHCPYHDPEVCHGLASVSSRAGTESPENSVKPTDNVQLDLESG